MMLVRFRPQGPLHAYRTLPQTLTTPPPNHVGVSWGNFQQYHDARGASGMGGRANAAALLVEALSQDW